MSDNIQKETHMQKPIERHNTASWANTKRNKRVSQVLIPNEAGVLNAKEYVDQNEK